MATLFEDQPAPRSALRIEEPIYTDRASQVRNRFDPTSDFARGFASTASQLRAAESANLAQEAELAGDTVARDKHLVDMRLQQSEAAAMAPRVSRLQDIHGIGDAVDFAQQGVASFIPTALPSIAAAVLTRGRGAGLASKLVPYAAATVPAYQMERNEAIADQYNDPRLAALPVEERADTAMAKGGINSLLEAVIPGRIGSSLLRRPVAGIIDNAITEGITEVAQEGVGYGARRYLDPEQTLDPMDLANAGVLGAIGGGGLSIATNPVGSLSGAVTEPIRQRAEALGSRARDALGARMRRPQTDEQPPGGPIDLEEPEQQASGGAREFFDEEIRPRAGKAYDSTKDFVSTTIDRMGEAAKTAQSPSDFLRQVFGSSTEDAAAADLRPDTEDPGVMSAADPAAALQQRDAQRQERAAAFAEELLNDPATPDAVKEQVSSFGGDFSNPEAQAFVARNLVSQRAGEKLVHAVNELIDLSKDFGGKAAEVGTDLAAKARGMLDKGMSAAADRIVKKNLQDATPAEQAAFNKLIFDSLTDEAKASPAVRQRLPELANAMLAFAARTGDLTKADLKTLSRMQDGLAMFRDPEQLAAKLTEYAGLPRTEDSFLSRVKRVTNAQQDILQPNSFLYSSLSEDAKDSLTQPQLRQIARLVDEFTLSDQNKAQGDKVLAGLTAAFGSKEAAQSVLDYYQKQNRADLRFDPNEGRDENAGDTYEGHQDIGEFGTLTERDAEEMDAGYRNPTPDQPFSRFFDRAELRKAVNAARAAGDTNARRATLREYVDQTEDETHVTVATRIRNNLLRRLRDAENRDTDSVQKALKDLESIPQEQRNEAYNDLVASLRSRKTENRTDLPRLRKEVEGMDRALGVTADELRNATPEQRAVLAERIAKNAPKLLDRYAVVMTTKDNAKASDARIKAFRKVLDDKSDTRGDKEREDWQARGKKTAIAFKMVGKSQPLRLSAESMVYKSNVRGSVARRLAESIGDVLNRHDVEGFITPSPDTIVKRVRGGNDITWGDIASEVVVRKNSPEQRAAIAKAAASRKAAAAKREVADFENRNGLLKALRDVQAESLRSEIVGDIPEGATLKVLSQLAPNGAIARAKDASFEAALQWGEKLSDMAAKYRTSENLSTPQKIEAAKVYSKLRVTEEYIEQQLDERFPLPEPGEFRERFSDADDAAGIYSPEGDYTADILEAEERIDALEARLESVSGIPGLYEGIRARIDRATEELDTLASGPDVFNRSRMVPGPRETRPEAAPKSKFFSAEAIDALYDVAVKENYDRLDTPEKVLHYAAMARAVVDKLSQIPESGLAKQRQELLRKLRADFKQDGHAAFDWGMLFNGMNPTKEQRAQLEDIVTKKSAMGGRPGAGTEKKGTPSRVILPITGRFTPKDQAKSDRANKFIGRGVPGSSTATYAEAWGDRANVGEYSPEDTVFISANGKRPGALSPPWPEIKKAMSAGATLITDVPADRNNRSFNTGERAVADFLDDNGYVESAPGVWTPGDAARGTEKRANASQQTPKTSQGKVEKKSFVGAKADPEGAARAQKALDSGAAADLVWAIHGWFRGPDGKLRKELRSPVLRTRVRNLAEHIMNTPPSKMAMPARAFFARVPGFEHLLDGLGKFDILMSDYKELGSASGAIVDRTLVVSVGTAAETALLDTVPVDTLISLSKEGVLPSSPSSPDLFATARKAASKGKLPGFRSAEAFEDAVAAELEKTIHHELQHILQKIEGFEGGGSSRTAIVSKYGDIDALSDALDARDPRGAREIIDRARKAMLADIGPDADPDEVAHGLYKDLIGEVEAFDVEKRFNLSDEEARRVLPDLMTPDREFLRTVRAEINAAKLHAGLKKSAMGGRPGRPGKNWGDKDAVKAEILRLRGKDVKVAVEKLVKQLGGSGQYSYDPATGERLIEVAINAPSPVGTARHEAMHDLFRFLSENDATRSVAKDLRDATSAPHVIRRLRELLKDHKAALEQLNDPEERAAYAYQFWAEGLLQIGPKGTGIFNTIRQFIKDLFGIVTAGQRGEDLLRAFHDGKFADPSTVQEVLQDINDSSGDRVANKLNRAAPALTRALNSLLSAAPERLRRFENDYLNELADKFQPEKGTGFVQNRSQQEGIWTNRLAGILRGTTAVERREAIDQLQAMKPTSKLAKELAKFNEDIYEYMRDAGVQSWDSATKKFVPLRKVRGYFTRSWDPDAIARNRSEFEALLRTEGGVSAADATALVENLVRGSEQRPKPKESPVDLGFMPYAPHTSERVLTFINSNNADKFSKFQRKDLADIMMSYVRGSTHRAEYAREFGNNGEKIVDLVAKSGIKDPKELGEISNAVQALEGSLDPGNWSVQTKEAMSAVLTLQNVTLLPLAIVSQMIDPIVLAARTGDIKDAGTAYVTALKRLKNTITKSKNKVPGEELAEILGVVSEDSTLQAMAMAYGTTRMSKRMENINRVFFKYNGMQGWNNSMRIAATAAGEKYLLAHKSDAKALAELGLEPKDIKSTGGKLDVSSPKVQQAMFQFVDQAVLRPSAANRPVWMSDPRFLLVAHLKQFTFAMHNVVLKRANRELQNDNPKPWGALMLAMPVILAADMAKFALTGTGPNTWGFKDYLVHAVERSGLLGLGDFGVQATRGVDMGKMPGEGLLGPTFENLMKILRWIGGDPRTNFGDVIDRTVPGTRFI